MPISRREFIESLGHVAAMACVSPRLATASQPDLEAIRSIGSQKILFVDRAFLANPEEVQLKLHPPQKTGERLLESEHPWESATLNWFSVLKDGDKYRMMPMCLAFSSRLECSI